MDGINMSYYSEKIKTIFLHVYTKDAIVGNFNTFQSFMENDDQYSKVDVKYNEIYYVVRLILQDINGSSKTFIEMWSIQIFDSNKEQKKTSLDELIKLNIQNNKAYYQELKLPGNVTVLKAVPAFGHLSSASIYPECLAPYMITLTCSDNSIRFLKCVTKQLDSECLEMSYEWQEWTMELTDQCSSSISLPQFCVPLNISCAYSGRVAVAYSSNHQHFLKDINIDIYECESSGGSEWILEDSIRLTDKCAGSKLNPKMCSQETTKAQVKESQSKKDFILIDWVNSEDGSHLLSVSLGTQIFIFTTTCSEISKYQNVPKDNFIYPKFARWMKVKEIQLNGSDVSNAFPDHISWAREGLLIIGLNNELHVYNQWNDKMSGSFEGTTFSEKRYDFVDKDRDLTQVMNIALNENFSIARLKDAYYSKNDFKRSYSRTYLENIEIEAEPHLSSNDFLQNSALFEAAQIYNPVLPQYHPKQLMEWINFGKISRVMAILSHLTSCTSDIIFNTTFSTQKPPNNYTVFPVMDIDDLLEKSQLEIKAIPPLSLHVLLEIDLENENKLEKKEGGDILCSDDQDNVIMDFNVLIEEDDRENSMEKNNAAKECENKPKQWMVYQTISQLLSFGPKQARQLSECLTRIQLPGLSTLDQVYLLGIAELMSNIKSSYAVYTSIKRDSNNIDDRSQQKSDSSNSTDDCGLRYLLAMQHFSYMSQTLPINQRINLMNNGMETSSLIWGFHSETEDELCARLEEMTPSGITWDDFKRYGCGWWIRNDITLQRIVEKITKNIFQKTKDPMDTAIFYLAMGKQKLLSKLFKNASKDGLGSFFMLDFTLPENRTRALTQAFKMRSRRRYDHAVALFLLCKSIDDALLICLHNLKDIQMTLTISRLYDLNVTRTSKNLESIITTHVIESEDPFIRSMGYWMIKEYTKSLDTLLQNSAKKSAESSSTNIYNSSDPVVFVFYNFLKKHPIILKQNIILNKALGDDGSIFRKDDYITPKERRLFFRTAYTYLKMGCPDLALEVLSKLPEELSTIMDKPLNKTVQKRILLKVKVKSLILD